MTAARFSFLPQEARTQLTLLFCLPGTIVIALTGDVYATKDVTVYRFKDGALLHLVFMAIL